MRRSGVTPPPPPVDVGLPPRRTHTPAVNTQPRRIPLASRSNVVVADRRQTAMRKPVGDGRIVLAGAWGAKEEQLRNLEKENRDLAERCAKAEAQHRQAEGLPVKELSGAFKDVDRVRSRRRPGARR